MTMTKTNFINPKGKLHSESLLRYKNSVSAS